MSSEPSVAIWRALALVAVLFVGLAGCEKSSPESSNDRFAAKASKLVDNLAGGEFGAIVADFDPTMKEALSVSRLKNDWRTYQELLGEYRSRGRIEAVKKGALTVERVIITTANGTGEVRVTYHPDDTIAGLYFLKSGAPPP